MKHTPKNWFNRIIAPQLPQIVRPSFSLEDLEQAMQELSDRGIDDYVSQKVREEFALGILIALPETECTTELFLSETKKQIIFSDKQQAFRARLHIDKTLYIILPNFADGEIPTLSEMVEIFELASDKLKKANETVIDW